jgi:tetratricopeptide (TPR) repeat protein
MTAVPLVNRDGERDVITRLLEALHDGGGALVVHGEAGVGKSALLAWAADTAADRGMLVLTAAGVQSEMHLPFAALHQLLHPVLPRAENLPPPQRDAIRAAFAMSDAAVPDLFLVGLATLELLSEVADGSPVVVIADDAQWVDRSSADVLAFVARRVHRDPIVVLASVRDGHDSPLAAAGLPELRLGGLAARPTRNLLDTHFPALSSGARGGEAVLPRHLPVTARLEQAFSARAADLPAATRALLLVAAADDSGMLTEIMRATEIVTGARPVVQDLDPAVGAGLLRLEGPVARFRHPLVRSAVYQAGTLAQRHAAHAALASAANTTGAFDRAFSLYGAAAVRLREQGRLGVLAHVLAIQSWSAILVADFPAALISADEGARLAAETAQPLWEMQAWTAQATIAALRGDHAAAEDLAVKIERRALPLGAASNLALAQYARGLSALGRGRYEEAYDHLRRVCEPGDPAHHDLFVSFDIGDLAEAAAHSGHGDEARAIMRDVESVAKQTPSPWLHATLRYAQAVLADEEDAETAFKNAVSDKNIARWPFLQARLQLAYGEWLRRQRRTTESRAPLRAARDAFDALSVTPWGNEPGRSYGQPVRPADGDREARWMFSRRKSCRSCRWPPGACRTGRSGKSCICPIARSNHICTGPFRSSESLPVRAFSAFSTSGWRHQRE